MRTAKTPTVFVNGRFLSQRLTGVQRYALETLTALDEVLASGEVKADCDFVVVAPPNASVPPLKVIGFRRVGPLAGHAWEQLTLPSVVGRSLLVSFGPTGPLLKANQIVTVHDAAVYAVPQAFSWLFRAWYKVVLSALVRRTSHMMTVSHFAKAEVIRFLGASETAVSVSGEGWEHIARVAPKPEILAKHGLEPRRYVLAVSSLARHKNFEVVSRAAKELGTAGLEVAVVGAATPTIFGAAEPAEFEHLKLVGYVDDGSLRSLYENAAAFVFPSLYEGFGIPPLEAMALGCPVIASNVAAMPEVCGDAALYFSPHDADELAELIRRLASNPEDRERWVEKGRARLRSHGWKDSAKSHLSVVSRALRAEVRASTIHGKSLPEFEPQ